MNRTPTFAPPSAKRSGGGSTGLRTNPTTTASRWSPARQTTRGSAAGRRRWRGTRNAGCGAFPRRVSSAELPQRGVGDQEPLLPRLLEPDRRLGVRTRAAHGEDDALAPLVVLNGVARRALGELAPAL